jgi:mono/diheme cytochrome c family protein
LGNGSKGGEQMRQMPTNFIRVIQTAAILALAGGAYLGVAILVGEPPAHALPEYTDRTGESCGVCHVSAGGGGPRTLVGLLWSARGKQDTMPDLPGSLLAPGVTDEMELYDIACAGCHGSTGEGLFAMNLVGGGISKATHRSFIRDGIPNTEMPAFGDQFTAEQIEILVDFVTEISGGGLELPAEYPLQPAELKCDPISPDIACGGK